MSSSYNLGDYVELNKKRKGYIRFEGKVQGVGECFGVELDSKDLKDGNDGTFGGKKYFDVKPGFGCFVKKNKILNLIQSHSEISSGSPLPTIPSLNANDHDTKTTKNGSIKTTKKSEKKKRTKTPKNNKTKTVKNEKKKKSKKEDKKPSHKRKDSPRPRASTRDPRTSKTSKLSLIKSQSEKNVKPKKPKKPHHPTTFPVDGTNKDKLLYLFKELELSTSTSSKKTHKRTPTEMTKNKINLLQKTIEIINELEVHKEDSSNIDNLVTPNMIIKSFKNLFEPLLKDKKYNVQKEVLVLFDCLLLSEFTRNGMAEQILFSMKHLTNHLTHNNTKSVNMAKQSMLTLINEVLLEDNNKKMNKILIIELLRYSTSSKKKIIRKYCWMFIGQILEAKYNINRTQKKILRPPDDVIYAEKKRG